MGGWLAPRQLPGAAAALSPAEGLPRGAGQGRRKDRRPSHQEGLPPASPAQPGTSEEVRSEDTSCWTEHEVLRARSTLPRTWMGLWAALSSWVATGPLAGDKEAGTRQDTG